MATPTTGTAYRHAQRGPWSAVMSVLAVILIAAAWGVRREPPAAILCGSIGLVFVLLAAAFHELVIADEGDRLAVAFGPLPLARRTVRYADIRSVRIGRTLLAEGWGIHLSPRGGWVWNIAGRACVELELSRGKLRLGTDDPVGLADFLSARCGA